MHDVIPHSFDAWCPATRYEPGIGIAFHVDAHSAFEEGIAAVTLGSGIVAWHSQWHTDL